MGKGLLIGLVGVGAALLFMKHASASSSGSGVFPPGWVPPPGSVSTVSSTSAVGVPIKKTVWAVPATAGGQQAGHYYLFQNANAPSTDWAVMFINDASGAKAIVAMGSSQLSPTIAQAAVAFE